MNKWVSKYVFYPLLTLFHGSLYIFVLCIEENRSRRKSEE